MGVSLSGNSRGSSTKRGSDIEIFFVKRSPRFQHETEEVYSWLHYVGVHNKFCVQEVDLHLFKPLGQFIVQVPVKEIESAIKSEDAFTFGTDLVGTDLHNGDWLEMHS